MSENKRLGGLNTFDSMQGMQFNRKFVNPGGRADEIEWEDPAEKKGMSRYIRVCCIVAAVICTVCAISFFQELGGVAGILAMEMAAAYGMSEYVAILVGMIFCSMLGSLCLIVAFKKRR